MQQLTPNTLLQGGKYRIESVLGQGSFGVTYLAEHTSLGKKVCIKEFFMKELNTRKEDGSITAMSQGTLSYNYAQKFRKEAMNMARMEHPNIVRVTDSFEENGTYYYVMDYIDGQNLNDYIKQCPMSVDEATSTIKKVAEALIYMHDTMHMLHLDLKPGNVMRRKDGHIFLIDFGLSKHYDANGAPETSTTIGLGTAGYAPIEQANQAKSGEFRPTIDVYALGATFYKLLTGKTPPAASELVSDPELIEDRLREANIPQGVTDVVVNAMMPSVKKRTSNVYEFLSSFTSNRRHNQTPHNAAGQRESINTSAKEFINIDEDEATIINTISQNQENENKSVELRKGEDSKVFVKLTLEEVHSGATKKFNVKKYIGCPKCSGIGRTKDSACKECKGEGRLKGEEMVEVKIPCGVVDGMIITAEGKGNVGIRNGTPGNLNIYIKELPHPLFTRYGLDIFQTLTISNEIAEKGGKLRVHTLDNDIIAAIPSGTYDGKILRIRGKGIMSPFLEDGSQKTGDMIIKINVKKSRWLDKFRS